MIKVFVANYTFDEFLPYNISVKPLLDKFKLEFTSAATDGEFHREAFIPKSGEIMAGGAPVKVPAGKPQ